MAGFWYGEQGVVGQKWVAKRRYAWFAGVSANADIRRVRGRRRDMSAFADMELESAFADIISVRCVRK